MNIIIALILFLVSCQRVCGLPASDSYTKKEPLANPSQGELTAPQNLEPAFEEGEREVMVINLEPKKSAEINFSLPLPLPEDFSSNREVFVESQNPIYEENLQAQELYLDEKAMSHSITLLLPEVISFSPYAQERVGLNIEPVLYKPIVAEGMLPEVIALDKPNKNKENTSKIGETEASMPLIESPEFIHKILVTQKPPDTISYLTSEFLYNQLERVTEDLKAKNIAEAAKQLKTWAIAEERVREPLIAKTESIGFEKPLEMFVEKTKEPEKPLIDTITPKTVDSNKKETFTTVVPEIQKPTPNKKESPVTIEKPLTKVTQEPPSVIREVFAKIGDPIEITFNQGGWVFVKMEGTGVSFLARETNATHTSFQFRAIELGSYLLSFQLQDNSKGQIKKEEVRVTVQGDNKKTAVLSLKPEKPEKNDYSYAEELLALGQYKSALKEFLKDYEEDNPYLNEKIASIYFTTAAYDAAEKYWARNKDITGEYGEKAICGYMRIALAQKNAEDVIRYLKPFLSIKELSIEPELVGIGKLQEERGEVATSIAVFNEYLKRYPGGAYLDEVNYFMGKLYETNSPLRDLKKSKAFYTAVYQNFPESPYSALSDERVRYLNRHFFYVR